MRLGLDRSSSRHTTGIDYDVLAIPKPKRRRKPKVSLTAVYHEVDARDHGYCRVCQTYTRPDAILAPDGRHHHHLTYRSRGGTHTVNNLLTLCRRCHQRVHDGWIKLDGDASARDERGRGCVRLQHFTDAGWQVDRWV